LKEKTVAVEGFGDFTCAVGRGIVYNDDFEVGDF
jgi:hypothetical protein